MRRDGLAVLVRDGNPELELRAICGVALTVKIRIHESTTSESGFEICILSKDRIEENKLLTDYTYSLHIYK